MFGDTAQSYFQKVIWANTLRQADSFSPAMWYDMLEAYYKNNGLYDLVQAQLYENAIWTPGMKPLRNPAHRAVEFYVAKVWAGPLERALPIVTQDDTVKEAIQTIWTWSNWGKKKQTAARWFANFGDLIVKVEQKTNTTTGKVERVYLKPIKPKYVTEMTADERGFLTYIRIDVPTGEYMHTEVWSKELGLYRLWKHHWPAGAPLEQLGDPVKTKDFTQLGFDFIPIVHAQFQDIGEARGMCCFHHVLDKIDEANRQATRLHEILFRYNKPLNAVSANAMDASGKPLPPPTLRNKDGEIVDSGDTLETGDNDLITLPGMSKIEQLVPQLNYADALSILNAQMTEIARDLPELLYFELQEKGELSGIAVQRLLGPAIDKVLEARGNAESALVQANQMALTIAKQHQLDGFADLGTFENGDFDHSFAERAVIPLSQKEISDGIKTDVEAGMPLTFSMRSYGYSEDEVKKMEEAQAKQKATDQAQLGTLVLDAMRRRDQGLDSTPPPITSPDEKIADTAMNGAQVSSLVSIITQVSTNQLPSAAAITLIHSAFPALPIATIESMVHAAVQFTPAEGAV